MGFEARPLSQIPVLSTHYCMTRAKYLIFPWLSFFICKMGILIVSTSQDTCDDY